MHVKTTGWVGFGISPDGKIRDSDLFIGWVKDGDAYFSVSLKIRSFFNSMLEID